MKKLKATAKQDKPTKQEEEQQLYEEVNREVERTVEEALNALWRLGQSRYGYTYDVLWTGNCGAVARVLYKPLGHDCMGLRIACSMDSQTMEEDWSQEARIRTS